MIIDSDNFYGAYTDTSRKVICQLFCVSSSHWAPVPPGDRTTICEDFINSRPPQYVQVTVKKWVQEILRRKQYNRITTDLLPSRVHRHFRKEFKEHSYQRALLIRDILHGRHCKTYTIAAMPWYGDVERFRNTSLDLETLAKLNVKINDCSCYPA